jgi:hypothetical protein
MIYLEVIITQVWSATFNTVIIQRQKLEVKNVRIKNQSSSFVLWVSVIIIQLALTETSFWNSTKKSEEYLSHSYVQDAQSSCMEQNYPG